MTSNIIWVSKGKKRYVGGTITEIFGQDISTDVVTIALSKSQMTPPETFAAPDIDTPGATVADRVALKMVDSETPLGVWYCWGNIADRDEIEPAVLSGPHDVR